jgi:hypothetical protein
MATTIGKGNRYRPGQPYTPLPYIGGFMPNIIPDQVVSKSPFATPAIPSGLIDQTFAALNGFGGTEPLATASVPLPRMRPAEAPTAMDIAAAYGPSSSSTPAAAAATDVASPVTRVAGTMQPASRGGLLDLIFGPSKNGLHGFAGLLGGPQAGGLLGMLLNQQPSTSTPAAPRSLTPSQSYASANSAARERAGRNIGHSGSGSSSGNLGGVSSSGRRYDLDRNEWV